MLIQYVTFDFEANPAIISYLRLIFARFHVKLCSEQIIQLSVLKSFYQMSYELSNHVFL